MATKVVLIIALLLLLGCSFGVLAQDMNGDGCADQALSCPATVEITPACAPAALLPACSGPVESVVVVPPLPPFAFPHRC